MTGNTSQGSSPRSELSGRQSKWRLDRVAWRVLFSGLSVAIALILAGVLVALIRPELPHVRAVRMSDLPRAITALEPGGLFVVGLLVLVATPVAGVATMGIGFAKERRWLFCGASALVLGLLAAGLLVGLRG